MTFPVFTAGIDSTFAPTYPLQRSLRFKSSGYLYRTFTSDSLSRKKFTFSFWFKKGAGTSFQRFLTAADAVSANAVILDLGIVTNDALTFGFGGAATNYTTTTQLFRDPAAWYHIVLVVDTTSATATITGSPTDRIRIYVNGVQVTAFASTTVPTQNLDTQVYTAAGATTSKRVGGSVNGLMTDFYYIDNQTLLPTAFGAYNPNTSVWSPIAYTGTFAGNSYYLKFDNPTSTVTLGNDSSGLGNNWVNSTGISVTAGVTYDSMLDVPTLTSGISCNYPVINNISTVTTSVAAAANLETSSLATQALVTTMRMDTGAYYWEFQFSAATAAQLVGVYKTSATTVTLTPTTNVIGVRFDANAGTLDYTTDGTNYTSIATGLTGGRYFPYAASTTNAKVIYVNFGQRPFSYAIPTGYTRLNAYTINTAVPNSAKAFATTTYTGNNSTQTISNTRNGSSFQPDIVWGKSRSSAVSNVVYDSVRGTTKQIITDSTAAQTTQATGLTAFTSSGFTSGALAELNSNLSTYYAFQWSAGGGVTSWNFDGTLTRTATMTIASPCVVTLTSNGFSAGQAVQFTTTGALPTGVTAGVTYYAGNIATNTFNLYDTEANAITGGATGRVNTSGTQSGTHTCEHASKISVNKQTGVSIVSYVGVGANTTVGHGLGAVVDCAIIKSTTSVTNWPVYHKGIGNTNYLLFNGTGISTADSTYWNNTTPTSSVISLGTNSTLNSNGVSYIMYAFATVPGFSSFEGYTGDGATSGLFLYTGFKPRFAIFKQTSFTRSWITLNPAGQVYNVQGPYLFANTNASEGAVTTLMDFVSNGIKMRAGNLNTNSNAGTYVYMAWAESPFKYGLAG